MILIYACPGREVYIYIILLMSVYIYISGVNNIERFMYMYQYQNIALVDKGLLGTCIQIRRYIFG